MENPLGGPGVLPTKASSTKYFTPSLCIPKVKQNTIVKIFCCCYLVFILDYM